MREVGEAFDEAQSRLEALLGEVPAAQVMLAALASAHVRMPNTVDDLFRLGVALKDGAADGAVKAVGERLQARSLTLLRR